MDEITTARQAPRAAQASDTDVLYQPYRLGPFNLPNRIVMAPLTRSRHASRATCRAPLPPATMRNAHRRR